MADEGESHVTGDKEYAYQEPNILKRYDDGFIIREMNYEDIRIVSNWYCGLSSISPYDLIIAYSTCPDRSGFMVGELNGVVVGSCVRIPWADNFMYGSLFYVDEKHRGSGFGKKFIMFNQKYFADTKKGGSVDSGQEIAELYKAFGMKISSLNTVKYHGTAKIHRQENFQNDFIVKEARHVEFEKILEYDNRRFVLPNIPFRKAFLQQWLNVKGGMSVVVLNKNDCVVGYGQRRPCYREKSYQFGPIYADNDAVARTIFKELCHSIDGKEIFIDIWSLNKNAVKMMEDFGMKEEFSLVRMTYPGGVACEYKNTTFAVTSIYVCGY